MTRLKNFFRQLLGPEKRRRMRYAASKSSQCFIKSKQSENPVPAYLHDISETGAGFFFKSSSFEVGEQVEMYIENEAKSVASVGQIASQRIYYPENTVDLKYALFRYSIQFKNPIDMQTVNCFKNESDL